MVFFGENLTETDDADDEASFAYFGVRRSAPRRVAQAPGAAAAEPKAGSAEPPIEG